MTALIVIGIIVLFFAFLLSLKATITIAYCGEVALSVRVLFFKIKILPAKKKKYPRSMSAKKARKLKAKREKKLAKKAVKKAQKKQAFASITTLQDSIIKLLKSKGKRDAITQVF